MSRCLVTGACGFVGRHLVKALLERGDTVVGVDAMVRGTGGMLPQDWPGFNPLGHPRFSYAQKDCRDWFRWNMDTLFDHAFHLAAIVGGRQMIENNPLAVADDLSIDAAYWQWAARCRPKKSVVFSSSAVYPVHMQTEEFVNVFADRTTRDRLLQEHRVDLTGSKFGVPDMSYGWSKLTMEFLAKVAYEKHGLKSVIFRPFSGYGNDQDAAYPFPAICKRVAAAANLSELVVWGSGRQFRDWIHIDDCIAGVLHMMDQIDNAGAVNLSTGVPTSFMALAKFIAEVAGKTLIIKGDESQPTGVFYRVGDTAKQRSLGFTPQISLAEGVQRMMESLSRQP